MLTFHPKSPHASRSTALVYISDMATSLLVKNSFCLQNLWICANWCKRVRRTTHTKGPAGVSTFAWCAIRYLVAPPYRAIRCAIRYVTTKPTPDTVHSPTPGQLHVESIQLACTCALCCCYALCMKREELLIFYSFWLRCFVVMMQYVGFLGRSQLFGSQVKVGAPTWQLARANSRVGARQLRFWRAPSAPFFLFFCTLYAFPFPSRHFTLSCLQSNPRRARGRR